MNKAEWYRRFNVLWMASIMAFAWDGLAVAQQASTVWVNRWYCATCTNDGHIWGYDAFSGIQTAIDHASLPGTVRVSSGTYAERLNMRNGVAVLGAGSDVTFIDGGGAGTVVTFMFLDQETAIEGFTIQNGRSPGAGAGVGIHSSAAVIRNNRIRDCQGWGIEIVTATSATTIQRNDVERNDGGIYTNGSLTAITGNRISRNRSHGIQFVNTYAFTITNNMIVENDGDGVNFLIPYFPNNPDEMKTINNTIAGNKGAGIYGNPDPALKLLNNIVAGNGNCGISFNNEYDWGKPTANYNDVLDNTGGNYCGPAEAGPDDFSVDPIFRDPAGGDYHLWPSSFCVDRGTLSDAPATDFDGDVRPVDGNNDGIADVDVGADETGALLDHDLMPRVTLPNPVYVQTGSAFVPSVVVHNMGTHAETDLAVSCEISRGNETVFIDQWTLPQLAYMGGWGVSFSPWIPQEPGEYRMKFTSLLAGDENPLNDTQVRTVQVISLKAAFGFRLTEENLLPNVQFTDQSTGEAAERHWDFGDNTTSSDRNPVHAYAEPGTYAVKLTVSEAGLSDSRTQNVVVLDIFGMSLGNHWTSRTTGPGSPSTSQLEIVTVPQETYDATGTWSYSLAPGSLNSNSSPGCAAIPSQAGSSDITQLGKVVTVSIDGLPHSGSVSGAVYSTSVSYPLLGGTVTERVDFQLASATAGSGSFLWEWSGGGYWCKGGNSLTLTRPNTQTGLPANLIIQEEKEDWILEGHSWYERASGQLKLWGIQGPEQGTLYNLRFSNGLLLAWYPMAVGDHRESSASVVGSTGVSVSMEADVLAQEEISLGFGPVRTYKLRYRFRTWGNGTDVTKTSYQWIAPYLGVVKSEGDSPAEELTSFAIGGGAIDLVSDADSDGLKDYQELDVYGTNWQIGDTDGDGCGDGAEALGGRNPNAADPQGDLNGDCAVDMKDVILGLRAMSASQTPSITPAGGRDVDADGRVGLGDVIYILQKAAKLRSY